jgi:hypothetical protein
MKTAFFGICVAAVVAVCGSGLAHAQDAPRSRITIDGITYERVNPTAGLDKLVNDGRGARATCISGDGKKVCPCGDKPCLAGSDYCGCITVTPPPAPSP